MNKASQLFIFLALNFGCLGLSNYLMGAGSSSEWYQQLPRAPWTPPGWVFGAAWSLIMVCFAVYMATLRHKELADYRRYGTILVLCVLWNALFFQWHQIVWALLVLVTLALSVLRLTVINHKRQGQRSWLMLPFCVWTMLASTLNAYPVFSRFYE